MALDALECPPEYVGTLHEHSVFQEFCGKNGVAVWIKMEKIQTYMGTLHGNIWERCTQLYGIAARKKH